MSAASMAKAFWSERKTHSHVTVRLTFSVSCGSYNVVCWPTFAFPPHMPYPYLDNQAKNQLQLAKLQSIVRTSFKSAQPTSPYTMQMQQTHCKGLPFEGTSSHSTKHRHTYFVIYM